MVASHGRIPLGRDKKVGVFALYDIQVFSSGFTHQRTVAENVYAEGRYMGCIRGWICDIYTSLQGYRLVGGVKYLDLTYLWM